MADHKPVAFTFTLTDCQKITRLSRDLMHCHISPLPGNINFNIDVSGEPVGTRNANRLDATSESIHSHKCRTLMSRDLKQSLTIPLEMPLWDFTFDVHQNPDLQTPALQASIFCFDESWKSC